MFLISYDAYPPQGHALYSATPRCSIGVVSMPSYSQSPTVDVDRTKAVTEPADVSETTVGGGDGIHDARELGQSLGCAINC